MAEFKNDAPSLKPEHREALERAAAALRADCRVTVQPADRLAGRDYEVCVRSANSVAIMAFDEARMVEAVSFIERFAAGGGKEA